MAKMLKYKILQNFLGEKLFVSPKKMIWKDLMIRIKWLSLDKIIKLV